MHTELFGLDQSKTKNFCMPIPIQANTLLLPACQTEKRLKWPLTWIASPVLYLGLTKTKAAIDMDS